MSEIKRVALNSFEPQKVSDKVNKKLSKTIRISVILPESNEDKCPEYNYKEQLALTKKRVRPTKEKDANPEENGLDPFGEDDDDVKRIALEMEAKYGTGMIGKKRKGRKDDYADIGMGYDESDSFIDNTDGYDEIIPQNVTTLHGGFYINSGALEFKTDDEASQEAFSSSSEHEGDVRPAPHRKRIIESSDESDTASTSQVEKKPKMSTKNSMQLAIKKQLFSQNKIQIKKRRQGLPFKKTVKDLIREKRDNEDVVVPLEKKAGEESLDKKALKENKKPLSITSQNVQKVEPDYDNNQNKQNVDINKNGDGSDSKSANPDAAVSIEGESSQEGNKGEKFEQVALPENLPSEILEIVNKIKQAAIDYKGEKKIKFFTDSVNLQLLSLERKCKILGKSSRVKVYEHLAYYIKCRKETLIRRAKVLVQEDEEKRLERLTKRLKDLIDQLMLPLLASYELESQKVLQKKFSKESVDNEQNKALKLPRRRFVWNDETRKLLRDIMFLKKKILILEGKQKDNLEDQIVLYLRTKVLPLWPEGWMYLSTLKKVFNSTSDTSKPADRSLNASASNSSQQPKHSSISINTLSNSKDSSNKPPATKPNSVKSYSKSSKPANISSIAIKKAETEMDNSFNELLQSIKKDFPKAAEAKKSGKSEDGGRADNSYVEQQQESQHREKSATSDSSKHRQSEKVHVPSDLLKHKQIDKVHVSSDLSKQKPSEKVHSPSELSKHKQIEKVHSPSDLSKLKQSEKVLSPSDLSKLKQSEKVHSPSDLSKLKQNEKVFAPSDLSKLKQNEKVHAPSDLSKLMQNEKVHSSSELPKLKQNEKVHSPSDLSKLKQNEKVHSPSELPKLKQNEKVHSPSDLSKLKHIEKVHSPSDLSKLKQNEKVHSPSDLSKLKQNEKVYSPSDLSKLKQNEKVHSPSDLSKHKLSDKIHSSSDLSKHKQSEKVHSPSDLYKHKQSEKVRSPSDLYKHKLSEKVHSQSDVSKHKQSDKVHVASDFSKHKSGEKPHVPPSYAKHEDTAKLKPPNDVATDYSRHAKQPEVMNLSLESSGHKQSPNDAKKHIDRTPASSSERDGSKYEAKKPPSIDNNDASKHVRHNDVLKLPADSSVIVVNTRQSKEDAVSLEGVSHPKDAHCHVMDLTEKSKVKAHEARPFTFDGGQQSSRADFVPDRYSTSPPFFHDAKKNVIKPIAIDIPSTSAHKVNKSTDMFPNSPPYFVESKKNPNKSMGLDVPSASTPKLTKFEGDDILMVMENLKALQKLSASPVKSDTSTGSPVSVIAFNKNFSSKSNPGQNAQQRTDKAEFPSGFQDEFQKQFINSLQQMSANAAAAASSKSNYRCS